MTLSLKHKFTSAIPDAGDPTIVQPSNWNDEHALTQATGTILGRVTAGDGVTEELTAAQVRTLLNVADGATANQTDAYLLDRTNHTGTESADVLTDGTTNKAYTAIEQTKLAGIAAGATANSTDAFLLARANHTGTQSADTLTDGTTNKAFLATERTKLAGIATGATANSSDATLLARANHTGTQLAATISDFSTAADARIAAAVGVTVQPLDSDLTAIAALTTTAFGRSLLTAANAAAGFDALAPTTTRGDLIFRNATTNARLAASTAGYLLQTNGAGTDPTWAGFLQAGTSAVTRTWQDKARERISVKDFGAVGDGVTDDTAAIQAAETYRASVAGELIFPPGTYQISATSVTANRANGGAWRGIGEAMLRASANSAFLCILTGAVAGTSNKPFLITGLHFHGGGFTSVRGVHETSPYGTTIENCTFTQMSFCASFIGPNSATQMGWLQISNIRQYGGGSWAFYGFDDTKYLFHIEMNNIHQVGTGSSANWENAFWIEGRRAVGLSINNCWSGSLDGGADGLLLRGDCQGVFVTNTTFVWPLIGIHSLTWTDTLKPSYVYMSNVGVDQHATSGGDIEGRTWFITNCNFANGYVRTNTGSGCIIEATSTDIAISNTLFAYDQKSGLVVKTGAVKVRVNGCTMENNNQVAGAFYDVDLQASSYTDVVLYGKNYVAGSVSATGQRLINGVTSKVVSLNNTPASTTAVTTAENLMSYTIPAAALKVGQRVRVKAWGTTGANANTKTGRLWFGANNMGGWSGALNAVGWSIDAEVDVTGSATQSYVRQSLTSSIQVASGTGTDAISGTIVVKFQGQNGTASAGDITCNGLEVEIMD